MTNTTVLVTAVVTVLLSFSTSAVVTKNCPETLNFKATAIKVAQHYANDNWNTPGLYATADFLSKKEEIEAELTLQNTYSSKCYYTGQDSEGNYFSANLKGSTRANAKEKAVLVMYSKSYVMYMDIKEVKKTGLSAKYDKASLYYQGEYCSWGDCVPDHILMGEALFNFL